MKKREELEGLRHRRVTSVGANIEDEEILTDEESSEEEDAHGPCERISRWMQDSCYQMMAYTFWDSTVSGFKPGRVRAFALLDIQDDDRLLLVGEGSGLDFECLPRNVDKKALRAFDFSSEMVRQSKVKARKYGIPEENCFEGDAQKLPFTNEKFDKIYFPLSLASIPNPKLALREAERVLAPGGKIVVFEKLMDEGANVTWGRQCLNVVTSSIFADINRNLPGMFGKHSPLKITHYESLENKLDGYFAGYVGGHYRLAVVVRAADYAEQPAVKAVIMHN